MTNIRISASVGPLSVTYSEEVDQLKHQAYWHIQRGKLKSMNHAELNQLALLWVDTSGLQVSLLV